MTLNGIDVANYQSGIGKTGGTGESSIFFGPPYSLATDSRTINLNETWQRVTDTYTITADGPIFIRAERDSKNTNTLLIAGINPERGAIATPYSPAPEDILN